MVCVVMVLEDISHLLKTVIKPILYFLACCWILLNVTFAACLRGALAWLWILTVAISPLFIAVALAHHEELRQLWVSLQPRDTLINEELSRRALEALERERKKTKPLP